MELIIIDNWQTIWAENKYWIMAHSQQNYNTIRLMAKNNQWSPEKTILLTNKIQETELIPPTTKTLATAYQHVWGYFKKECTPSEKTTYMKLLQQLTPENDALGPFLKHLTEKYQEKYLLKSKLMKEQPEWTPLLKPQG